MIAPIALAALLDRMGAINADLHSYTATLRAQIKLTSFPFLQTAIVGTIYRREPDKERLEVTSGLPGVAQQFGNLYPNIVSPAQWREVFIITPAGESNGVAHLRLVPREQGNVASIVADVRESTALIIGLRWNYRNGGYAELTQHYARIGADALPVSQEGHIEEPGYVAEISATIGDYRLNVPLSDDVFRQ